MASAVACGVCCWKAAWSPDVSPDEMPGVSPDVDACDADDEESQPDIKSGRRFHELILMRRN